MPEPWSAAISQLEAQTSSASDRFERVASIANWCGQLVYITAEVELLHLDHHYSQIATHVDFACRDARQPD